MSSAIIGSRGFIGSRLQWYTDNFLEEEWIGIHRDNYELWETTQFNKVIWAGGSASKEVCEDWKIAYDVNVSQVKEALADFPCDKFIYISSQAIYPPEYTFPDENVEINDSHLSRFDGKLSTYGRSKLWGEVTVKSTHPNYIIIRPNGFVGPGLKKNVIHSLAKDQPELYYTWGSKFQIIHTDIFAAVSFMLASSFDNEIFNVTLPQIVTPVYVASVMGIDIEKVVSPAGRIPPVVDARLDTTKLERALKEANIALPSAEEAIRKWNEPFEIQMPRMRSRVGRPQSRR